MKKDFFSGLSMLLMGVAFVGCSHEVSVDENYAYKKKVMEYDAAFKQTYGTIAKGQTWGFKTPDAARTRGSVVHTDSPLWKIPTDMTKYKEGNYANAVAAAFIAAYENGTLLDLVDVDFDFDNYWMLHIEKAKQHNTMGQLQAYDPVAKDFVDVEHFTSGQNNAHYTVGKTNALHGGTLMVNMENATNANGKMFRWGSDNNWSYDYKFLYYDNMLFLGLPKTVTNGNGNGNGKGNGNGNANNTSETSFWVILITEAEQIESEPYQGRVFCEDMGEIGDFDFNDLVYDAVFNDDKSISIEILAAGGTLPITVAGHPVTLGKMTNTGVKKAEKTQKFIIDPVDGDYAYESINAIPVVVTPTGDAQPYELEAKPETAPQKICTYIGVLWPDEYVRIDKAYNNFKSWVNNALPEIWIQNMVARLTDKEMSNNADDYVDPEEGE